MQARRGELAMQHLVVVGASVLGNQGAKFGEDLMPRILSAQRKVIAAHSEFHLLAQVSEQGEFQGLNKPIRSMQRNFSQRD